MKYKEAYQHFEEALDRAKLLSKLTYFISIFSMIDTLRRKACDFDGTIIVPDQVITHIKGCETYILTLSFFLPKNNDFTVIHPATCVTLF